MSIIQSSSFVGTPVNELFELLILGAESIERGLIDIFPDRRKEVFLNRFDTPQDSLVQRVPTPSPGTDFVKDERSIVMGEAMFYGEFDPLDFGINDWRFLWSQGSTVRAEASAQLERAIISTVAQRVNENLDKLIWAGDEGSGDAWLSIFDGFIVQMQADGSVILTTPAVINASNVISVLEEVVASCPASVQEKSNPVIITDHQTKYFYRESARALDVKGSNIDGRIGDFFGGFPLISVGGMPASHVVMTHVGPGSGNLKGATWMDSDRSNVLIDRLQANSDEFFAKVSFDMGVNHVWGQEVVLHTDV